VLECLTADVGTCAIEIVYMGASVFEMRSTGPFMVENEQDGRAGARSCTRKPDLRTELVVEDEVMVLEETKGAFRY
jgi:hypothetical protein